MKIQIARNHKTALKIGDFLTGPNAFDQTWAPDEADLVKKAPLDSLKSEKHRYWYVEEKGQLIAAMGVRENKYGSGGYEMNEDYLAVHQDFRRQGIASVMLVEVEKFVKSMGGRYIHILSCDIESYKPASAFYEKHGYKKVGEIPDYYVEGEGRIDYFKKLE